MDGRGRTTDRLVRLILLVQRGRTLPPIAELAREHGVCRRTIQRDLLAIEGVLPVRRAQRWAA